MRAVAASPSARGLTWAVDTLSTLTRSQAQALVNAGVSARMGYVDHVSLDEVANQLGVGLLLGPVTYALEFDWANIVAKLKALGIPAGVTVWLDVEGVKLDPATLIGKENDVYKALQDNQWEPGRYAGAQQLLSSEEQSALVCVRYWHACSQVLDRYGKASEPLRGYCARQLRPDDVMLCGVRVDVNILEPDYHGDLPTFAG